MKHIVSVFFLFALLTGLSACGARQYPEPADGIASSEELLAHLEQRAETVHSARTRAVMEYFGGSGRVRVRQVLVVSEPHFLRLETMSPFDTTLALVVANDDELTFYDLGEDQVYVGRPTAANLSKLIPLWLAPSDIVDVVLGGVPMGMVDRELTHWKVAWDGGKNAWRLFGRSLTGGYLEFLVRHDTWSLAGARELDRRGNVQWEIRAAEFRRVGDGESSAEVPSRIRFLMPSADLDVSLSVQEYELNPELDLIMFEIFTPEHDLIPLDD